MSKPFVNPYALDRAHDVRIMSLVPYKKWEAIRTKSLRHGTMVIVINQMWDKLLTACEQYGINEQRTFEHFVANSELVLADSATERILRKALPGSSSTIEPHPAEHRINDATGATRLHGGSTEVSNTIAGIGHVGGRTPEQGVPMESTPHLVNDSQSGTGRGSSGSTGEVATSKGKKAQRVGRSVKGV